MSADDCLYHDFVERFYDSGERAIPSDWPPAVQERCRFFLDLVAGRSTGLAGWSVVSALQSRSETASEITLTGGDAPPPAELLSGVGEDRYVVEDEIAAGGMGRILLCYDRDFRRRIAMKILKDPTGNSVALASFVEEAQATAQLEHPNIGPVYDVGLDRVGSPYFTMKWIRGRNLDELLEEDRGELTLIRRVQILQQVAMGIDFAHSRGVVHRDLKPQNVMVGDFGEVLVVDWGLAKVLGRPDASADPDLVITSRAERGEESLRGTVKGSLLYMAPEQARGDPALIDARTDVFGLGAILYVLLTGEPSHAEGSFAELLRRVVEGNVPPPGERVSDHEIPDELDALCRRALAPRKEDRFESARAFHDALQRFVEGVHDRERRDEEARRLLVDAEARRADLHAAQAHEEECVRVLDDLRARTPSFQAPSEKAPLWEAVAKRREAADASARLFGQTTAAFHSVLSTDPAHSGARRALAELFHERLVAAEERGDGEACRLYESLVGQYASPGDSFDIDGDETLRLDTDPPDAKVSLFRYEPEGIRLIERPFEWRGKTPLECRLPRGSWVAVIEKTGFAPVRWPFLLGRGGGAEGRLRLFRPDEIPAGFVYVPGGMTIVGGDPTFTSALPRRREHVDAFLATRFPVTLGDYCRFLDDRLGDGMASPDDEERLLPTFAAQRYVESGADGRYRPMPKLGPQYPVFAVRPSAVLEYCDWLGAKVGQPVRLLREVEWERCARGADGRIFPWGNDFDWSLCHGGPSRDRQPLPEPVGTFDADCSPFGIRDTAGCVRELCARAAGERDFPSRSGSWFATLPLVFRTDARHMVPERYKTSDLGFRVGFTP